MFELMTDPRLEPLDVNGQKFGKLTYFAFDDYVDYEGEAVIMSRRIIKGWVAELAGLQVPPKTGRIFLELTTTW
jgi:hypothetical protein